MQRLVYADNAATSREKPPRVWQAMEKYMKEIGTNPGRGGYSLGLEADRIVFSTRRKIAELFNGERESNVFFSLNVTHALNMIIKGFLREGDQVVTSSMEHNAVARPLHALRESGIIDYTLVQCTSEGYLLPEKIEDAIRSNTKMIVVNHASNVTGTIMPVKEIGEIAKRHGILYVLDCAQTAGVLNVDMESFNADVIAFTGHKSLMGPQGVGGCFLGDGLNLNDISAIFQGGTGSKSDMLVHPDFMPDKFESGTPNTVGIAGLGAALDWLMETGEEVLEHERMLTRHFLDGLNEFGSGVKVYGPQSADKQTAVVSLNLEGLDGGQVCFMLDKFYGIMTRSGLHCSPLAHKTIGSFPEGTIRFSFGYYNTREEIDYILQSLKEISQQG